MTLSVEYDQSKSPEVVLMDTETFIILADETEFIVCCLRNPEHEFSGASRSIILP